MIVPMTKYDIVLFHAHQEDFLARLQELGLVDITIKQWEPSERDRELLNAIERHKAGIIRLKEQLKEGEASQAEPFTDPDEAYDCYEAAAGEYDRLTAELNRARKEVEELRVWGEFSSDTIQELREQGIELHYFWCYTNDFRARLSEWEQNYHIEEIDSANGVTHFIVLTHPGDSVAINAQAIKAPAVDYRHKEEEIKTLEVELEKQNALLDRCAVSLDLIREHANRLHERLHLNQAVASGTATADDTLVILEGWATRETSPQVDAMLDAYPDLIYLKSLPTPEDDTPVQLRNNRFARLFELIGGFYSLPKYGTMDLTPYFGPFYMLFFGFCLADAGYGLLLFLGGLFMLFKGGDKLKSVSKLTMLCGSATIVFGFFVGSFFGIQLANLPAFVSFRDYFLSTDNLFTLALGVGILQILFGMALKVVNTTQMHGFKYALSTLGWMIVIISSLAAYLLPDFEIEGFSFQSPIYLVCLSIGLFMMFFLNSPGKNPLANFGSGLWNTYNDITGLLGDVLSYIRLFAIGLSGGILALVFNDLAIGLSPDIPVLRQICVLLILLIGHGINLFMSTLSSFVHPMRLTFVEFYKNAGFEATQRAFNPLKQIREEK